MPCSHPIRMQSGYVQDSLQSIAGLSALVFVSLAINIGMLVPSGLRVVLPKWVCRNYVEGCLWIELCVCGSCVWGLLQVWGWEPTRFYDTVSLSAAPAQPSKLPAQPLSAAADLCFVEDHWQLMGGSLGHSTASIWSIDLQVWRTGACSLPDCAVVQTGLHAAARLLLRTLWVLVRCLHKLSVPPPISFSWT